MDIAQKILAVLMTFRRISLLDNACKASHCKQCALIYLPFIVSRVEQQAPITCVLPAFPAKSPNLEKVLGYLPDQGERLALIFLDELCKKIKTFYAPGMQIILCSDGRVFSDVVGMLDVHVSAYQEGIEALIRDMSLSHLSTFHLDHCYPLLTFNEKRKALLSHYGKPLDFFKALMTSKNTDDLNKKEIQAFNQLYRGITRFLFEDSSHLSSIKTRSKRQKEAREKAYEVIRRSDAWSELIDAYFPYTLRLSIHPQVCGSRKLGIRLIDNETWMTPWHGVVLENHEGYHLVKRFEAEALGAYLCFDSQGSPSHYILSQKEGVVQRKKQGSIASL